VGKVSPGIGGSAMKKEEKLKKLLADKNYTGNLIGKFKESQGIFDFKIILNREPENYVRERYTGRGHRFYNAKEKVMKEIHKEIDELIPKQYKKYLDKLMKEEIEYYTLIDVVFYVKIPKADSVETTILKETGQIRPAIAPDLDNYIKLLADVMHNTIYTDDKRLVGIDSKKLYSLNPRTEITFTILIPNVDTEFFKKGE
jgi:Holliday junction resolvase RusA-like endonuclease